MSLSDTLVSAPRVRTGALDAGFLSGIPVSETAARAVGAQPSLDNLMLPVATLELLQPCVEELGYRIGPGKIEDPFGGAALGFTLVSDHQLARYLIRFPPADEQGILQNPSQQNRRLVSGIWERFAGEYGREITLHLFHGVPPDGDAPHGAFKLEMENRWQRAYGITTQLHPLRELEQLGEIRAALKQRVTTWLELHPAAAAGDAAPAARTRVKAENMLRIEQQELSAILARHPSFGRLEDRQSLLALAGLDAVAGAVNLDRAPSPIADELVFVKLSTLQLGLLIAAMPHAELPTEDEQFLTRLTDRYDFAE